MLRRFTWVSVIALLPLAGMATVAACGGDDSNTGDSGPDVTTQDVAKDVAPDVKDAAPEAANCADAADLTQFLPSADASIDVDAGGLNLTLCTGCLKSSCGTDINACNQDCDCRQAIIDAVTCVAQGGSFQNCAAGALGNNNAQNLFFCALSSCSSVCLPPDGGTTVKDAAADAPDGGG